VHAALDVDPRGGRKILSLFLGLERLASALLLEVEVLADPRRFRLALPRPGALI
jgi:hypothetical protein